MQNNCNMDISKVRFAVHGLFGAFRKAKTRSNLKRFLGSAFSGGLRLVILENPEKKERRETSPNVLVWTASDRDSEERRPH